MGAVHTTALLLHGSVMKIQSSKVEEAHRKRIIARTRMYSKVPPKIPPGGEKLF